MPHAVSDRPSACAAGVYYCSNYRATVSTPIVALGRTALPRRVSTRLTNEISIREARNRGDESCDHSGTADHCYRLNLPG